MKTLRRAKAMLRGFVTISGPDRTMLTTVVSAEAPQLTLSDVDIPMDTTGSTNGHSREHTSSDTQRGIPMKIASGRAGTRENLGGRSFD